MFSPNSSTPAGTVLTPGDYVAPGLELVWPDPAFPNKIVGDTRTCPWQYLRREIPHHWYVDQRAADVGFLSRDEAHILHNVALQFRSRRALEIGCWLGWSACHLALAGVQLDVIDPLLENPDVYSSVVSSLSAAGVLANVTLEPGYSPTQVHEVAKYDNRRWSLFFIDGNHDAPFPLNDTIACLPYAEPDAAMVFHDLASPEVSAGLDFLQDQGWQTMVYQTMQVMGVAWRGNVQPVAHIPDPSLHWPWPEHLRRHPVSGWSATFDPQAAADECRTLFGDGEKSITWDERQATALYHLARRICEQDTPGDFLLAGAVAESLVKPLTELIAAHSRRPRNVVAGRAHESYAIEGATRRSPLALVQFDADAANLWGQLLTRILANMSHGGCVVAAAYFQDTASRETIHALEHERQMRLRLNPINAAGVWLQL